MSDGSTATLSVQSIHSSSTALYPSPCLYWSLYIQFRQCVADLLPAGFSNITVYGPSPFVTHFPHASHPLFVRDGSEHVGYPTAYPGYRSPGRLGFPAPSYSPASPSSPITTSFISAIITLH